MDNIKRISKLLSSEERGFILKSVFIHSFISLLDLFGVALLSLTILVVSLPGKSGLQNSSFGKFVESSIDVENNVVQIFIATFAFFLLKSFLALSFSKRLFKKLSKIQVRILDQVIISIMRVDYSWIKKQDSKVMAYSINHGIAALVVNYFGQVVVAFSELFLIISLLLFLTQVNFLLTIFCVAYLLLVAGIMHFSISKKISAQGYKMSSMSIINQRLILERLSIFREIRILGRNEWFKKQVHEAQEEASINDAENIWIQQVPKYVMEIALIFAIIGLGTYAIIYNENSGAISSTFGAFIVVSTRIFPSLLRLQGTQVSLRLYRETAESALRLIESLDEATSRIDLAVNKDFQSEKLMSGNFIEIKKLDYFHEENSFPTLKGIDLVIKRGERVIITGPSGSGKTTICDLMLGLIQPTSGKVLIEDILPQDWLLKSESAASYLPQDTKLITGTILENILLGASESQYSQEKISEVVKVSQLGKFIAELPLGLNTQVGENGVRLSGGQKQRLGIARALLNSPSLLIMDEATSALDTKMEHDFFDLFNELPKSITIILIAHRFSSMLTSKRIVYMESGKIIAEGPFLELIDSCNSFREQARLAGLL